MQNETFITNVLNTYNTHIVKFYYECFQYLEYAYSNVLLLMFRAPRICI